MKQFLFFVFVQATLLCQAQTFSQIFNQTVPDDGTTVMYNVPVSGLQNAIDTTFGLEGVCIKLTHTWDDDMEVKLQSPDGSIVILFTHVGGDGDDFNVTCFNGISTVPISSGSAPFNSAYRSMGDLGQMNSGQNPNGNWTLILHDTYPFADQGFLIGWGLTFGNQPMHPAPPFSSNLPIIKINTHGNVIPNEPKIEADFAIIDHGTGVRNFVNDTNYVFVGKIMTEQQGYSGPSYPKKNYDFYTINSDSSKLDTSLLGMPTEHDWILKAEYLDHSLMANTLTYEMSRRMGIYAPRTKYCEVTVDGEYVGVYSLTEKVKRDANRVDLAKLNPQDTDGLHLTGGYIIEMNINGDPPAWTSVYPPINNATCTYNVEFKEVYPKQDSMPIQQHEYIKNYVDSFELALQNDSLDPNTWRDLASEKSFINFQIINEFSANYDSYGRSTYMFKDKGKKLNIGPPWDYDRGFAAGTETGWVWLNTHPYWPFPFWWSKLNSDSVYLKKLYCRWTELRMNVLSNDSFNAFIDSTSAFLQESAARNFQLWGGVANYNDAVTDFKNFVSARLAWMDANIFSTGEIIPTFSLNDTTVCKNETVAVNIGNQYHYTWSSGDTTNVIAVAQTNTFTISVEDDYGCSATDDITVYVNEPNASFATAQDSVYNFSFSPVDVNAANYQWQFGDDSISNFKLTTHTYDTAGTYVITLTVTDSIGCSNFSLDTITIVAPVISGIANPMFNGVKIYPNPFNDYVEIEISNLKPETGFELNDVSGRKIRSGKLKVVKSKISTQDLEKGIYFIELKWEGSITHVLKLFRQ